MGETERVVGYEDWDKIVKNSQAQLDRIDETRVQMCIAEELESQTLKTALKRRDKCPLPNLIMEDTENPVESEDESPEEEE